MIYSSLQQGCAGNTWGEQPDSALITPQASGWPAQHSSVMMDQGELVHLN